MRTFLRLACLLLLSLPALALEPLANSTPAPLQPNRINLPALQTDKLRAEDLIADRKIGPFRYGVTVPLVTEQKAKVNAATGVWEALGNGEMRWRAEVFAKAAKSLEVIAHPFRLPEGAKLSIFDQTGKLIWGPFDSQENNPAKTFPSPIVAGELMRLEITAPAAMQEFVEFEIAHVKQGYRSINPDLSKRAGGCNVDVICPAGDAYRNEIRSVVAIYLGTTATCTGTLVNNTRQDGAPLLLTADHCGITAANASQVRVYYNYQSPSCRPLSAGTIEPISVTSGGFPTSAGFSLLARSEERADFTLLRLNGSVPATANAYYMGWDRTDSLPATAVVIHHPEVEEKRISQSQGSLSTNTVIESFTDGGGRILPIGTAIVVPDYGFGTTEPGSSGSALFNQNSRRIIGTLSGGSAKCVGTSNQGRDLFGRLFVSWTGDGSSSTRLRDHLDPINTGAQTLDARGSCTAPTATITGASIFSVREDANYTVNASGGTGPYTYTWDVEGDGADDRTTTRNALTVRYDRNGAIDLRVKVTDATGCSVTVQKAVNITAPEIRLNDSLPAQQICGNNDNQFDPGERWRIRTELRNTGAASSSGLASFASLPNSAQLAQADSFGYRYSDQSASCKTNYTDVSSVAALNITAAPGSDPEDDGRAVIDLGANAFEYYGENVTSIAMSTNGYLVINPSNSVTGGDFRTINCGNEPASDGGRRIRPLHRDLLATAIRAASAASCPRPADIGSTNQPCVIFDWSGMRFLAPGTFAQSGQFDMQAIVYPQSKQIVFQYRGNLPSADLDSAVSGLMNTATPAYNYMCKNTGPARVAAGKSVCFFHPSAQPSGGVALEISQGLAPVGNLPNGQSVVAGAEIRIPTTAACGAVSNVTYLGTIDDRSVSVLPGTVSVPIAANCTVVNNCALPGAIRLKLGNYDNPIRNGNGIATFVAPQLPPALPVFVGNWFTARPNRESEWYVISGNLIGNHVRGDLLRVTRGNPSDSATQVISKVGDAQVNLINSESYALTYQFTSGPNAGRSGGEIMKYLFAGLPTPVPDVTGVYYSPSDDGWGQSYSSFRVNGVTQQLILTFLYDAGGEPRWVIGNLPDSDASSEVATYEVACPACAHLDFFPTKQVVGTQTRNFPNGFGRVRIQTQFNLVPPLIGSWNRGPLDFVVLTPDPSN
jgi:lysyl endopeptidase